MNEITWLNEVLKWTPWIDLFDSWKNPIIPKSKGLYRIRRKNLDDLDYIGQTSSDNMNLRKRLSMLQGIFGEEMPYRDPHTVGPALWALKHSSNCEFEVSVALINGNRPWVKGMEAVALSLYRMEKQKSPNYNFGRMPAGYKMSSANNQKLANAGKRFKGGPVTESLECHKLGICPRGPLFSEPQSGSWCNFEWSTWSDYQKTLSTLESSKIGLYRIRKKDNDSLLYIGQGKISDRLRNHVLKGNIVDHTQSDIFRPLEDLEFSYSVITNPESHHLLELENDLIASYIIMTRTIPAGQFIG
jgi:hypothetical protein